MLRATIVTIAIFALALPSGASAASCDVRDLRPRALGPTYTTGLSVSRVSCTTGKRLVTSYYRCRVAAGGADGRCRKRVSNYRCTERRSNVISTQFDARVTCKRGSRSVVHTYTQFT